MRLACVGIGRLLGRRLSGLSAAEGLRLEEHLATCALCRADANLLHGLAKLSAETPVSLSETARQRALTRAFAAAESARAPHTVQRPRAGVLLLAAAAILATGAAFRSFLSRPEPPSASVGVTQPADRVLSGRVDGSDGSLAEHAQLHTTEGAVLALAHARVELRAESDASWDAGARKLSLRRGSALIEVDAAQHRSFSVETQRFTVSVLGTRFEVTQSAVHVLHGRVSVRLGIGAPETEPIVLEAGTEHADFELPPIAAASTTPDRTSAAPPPARARAHTPHRTVTAQALLEQARAQLAARELTQARSTLKLAAPQLNNAALRAQALSLQAECELLERHFAAARDAYLRVVQQFPSLPAAETALFAAARIEAEHGRPARARELLTSYLAKHPSGSFVREAEHRLRLVEVREPAEPAP